MAEYNFKHRRRGTAIIINNVDFQMASKRYGSDKDQDLLYHAFLELGFHPDDIIRYRNLTAEAMKTCIENAIRPDHMKDFNRTADCFVCAILTHGVQLQTRVDAKEDAFTMADFVLGTDEAVAIHRLVKIPAECPELAGKPKIFLVQACRGGEEKRLLSQPLVVKHIEKESTTPRAGPGGDAADEAGDAGALLAAELREKLVLPPPTLDTTTEEGRGGEEVDPLTKEELEEIRKLAGLPLPVESAILPDCLLAYATQPGFFAFRNTVIGSPFIRCFHKQVEESGQKLDLLQLLTRVNRDVAYGFTSENKREDMKEYDGKKMMPWVSSRLVKDIVFKTKEGQKDM